MDKKAFMRGKVTNKLARLNCVLSDFTREPDYENAKGRVVNFMDYPAINAIRGVLPVMLGNIILNAQVEVNVYHTSEAGIGWHGDAERRLVVGLRNGKFNLSYQWYQNHKPIGERLLLELNDGDMYVMDEKTTGSDWKRSAGGFLTLRHSAGSDKYTAKAT